MRVTLIVVGVLLMFFGAVWFLQGINVLPGSFMTGQTQWAVYGGSRSSLVSLLSTVLGVCPALRNDRECSDPIVRGIDSRRCKPMPVDHFAARRWTTKRAHAHRARRGRRLSPTLAARTASCCRAWGLGTSMAAVFDHLVILCR
jgi:hypothetical protein